MISLRIKNNLYRIKSFWQFNKWLNDKPMFLFWVNMFRGHHTLDDAKNYVRILKPTLLPFLGVVFYSAFIIAVLEVYNKYLPINSDHFDKATVDSFLTAVASITGVFLGLYFAAISSIASNFLIRATQDVRNFFLSAPAGMQYVRTVAITGIVSVFYLFVKSLGHTIHPAGLVFLALLAAYVVIRFWSVGSSVFNSMEPGNSFPFITKDIVDSIREVTPPGFQWNKSFLQNHRRRLVSYNLDLLNNLINFGIRELNLPSDQLLVALRYVGGLLFIYSEEKRRIPTNSFWYEIKNQFEDWAFADSTKIALALNTGTSIQPKTIRDFSWFEKRNLDIAVKILKNFAGKKDVGSIFQGCEVFIGVAEVYGKDLDEPGLRMLFEKLDEVFVATPLEKIEETQVAYREQLAFMETQGRLAVAAVLGLVRYLDEHSCESISKSISEINWNSNKRGHIYLTGLPVTLISRLESIASNLSNEKLIEGRIISPKWYIKTLCIQEYLYSLQKYFEYLKSLHVNYFQPKFEKLLIENQYSLAVHFLQRWLEFSNKYQSLVNYMEKHIESCAKFHWVKDLPFPVFDFPQEKKGALARERDVSDKLIQLLPKLKTLVVEDDLPDYFGQALTLGLEACYEACKEQDVDRLKVIFPIIFDASITAHDKIRKKVQDWSQDDSKIIYSTEPLANLLDISGFAVLYSELYGNDVIWNVVKSMWDAYLQVVDAKAAIQFIVAIVGYRDSLFVLMPQAILRTNWQMDFTRKMKDTGLPVFPEDRYYDRQKKISHQSSLIRVIAKWGGLMAFSAQDVFLAIYLSNHPGAKDLTFPDKHDLKEGIKKEEKGDNEEEHE
jgi:hypothetical protein